MDISVDNATSISVYTSLSMAIVGCASTLGSLLVITSLLTLCILKNDLRLPSRLVLYLCIADAIQGIGNISSFAWLYKNPDASDTICIFQGFMLQFGDVASSVAAAVVGTFVFLTAKTCQFKTPEPGTKFEIVSILLIFGLSFGLALHGIISSLYGPVSYKCWCWILRVHSTERITMHYLFVFFVCVYLFLLYFSLAISQYLCASRYMQVDESSRQKIILKLMGFPIVFFVVFIPLGVDRFVEVKNPDPPKEFVAFAACMFSANGFFNALLYGSTRKIFPRVWMRIFQRESVVIPMTL